MPKKPDPALKTKSGIYESQKRQSEKFEERWDKIIVRVPEGSRDKIKDYVDAKAADDPKNLKYSNYNGKAYRPSMNAFIQALIEEEMGVKLKDLIESK